MKVTYDILICTIPHRRDTLLALLDELNAQIQPGVAARVCYDNLQSGYGAKCNALLQASEADYVSWVDDDDMVAPDFVNMVMNALDGRPDYVGFPVKYTWNGELMVPIEHSLKYGGWIDRGDMLCRDITQFNPIRRDLALLGTWSGGYGADRAWASGVRAAGKCQTEAWIDKPMYYYQSREHDTFLSDRRPFPASEILPLPDYWWLTEVHVQ